MTSLSLHRTFANPSYTPTKGTKIRKDRWCIVRMQKTSRDQGDGLYLEDGEDVALLQGDEARKRRDARLNHCNGITEYSGPVFALHRYPYNSPEPTAPTFYPSEEAAEEAAAAFQAEHGRWIADMEKSLGHQIAKATEAATSGRPDRATFYATTANEIRAKIDANRNRPWLYVIDQWRD
jgi:hypothetical protein